MPTYKYEIETARKLTEPEKAELRAVLDRAWAGMQRADERAAALAKTIHTRHLKRLELWERFPEGHKKAGAYIHPVHDPAFLVPHLQCSDCSRTLVGYGSAGGLACPEVARHPDAAKTACHATCVIECGEKG
jgi:hypothetical protein